MEVRTLIFHLYKFLSECASDSEREIERIVKLLLVDVPIAPNFPITTLEVSSYMH
jgi:hypothetical protein